VASHSQRIERIARLVREPSISRSSSQHDGSNRAVVAALADMLDAAGFRVEILPLPGAPEKQNLIATLGRGPGGLVLAGHTDTVPYDEALWQSDPFTLTARDDKLYGLGAADMKAFLALAVEAAEDADEGSLKAPLMIVATADEETTMDGARALVGLDRPRGRHALIGEPTDMRPVRAHKGVMMEQLRLVGRSGHSSDPRLGRSALDGMARVLQALLALRDELAARHRNEAFALPTPTLNLGRIAGGDNANRICGQCELDIDVRLLPGMDIEAVRRAIRERAEAAIEGLGLVLEPRSLELGTPAYEADATSALLRAAEELTGVGAEAVAFATEAPYLSALGNDTVVLGPGSIDQAHRPDEFVRADRLAPTVALLKAMVHRLCKAPPS